MAIHIRRRDFIATLGGAAIAWPPAARAQQAALPVVGLLSSDAPDLLQAFRQGLKDTGYIERHCDYRR
jgi:putative tryptophan/tyrosine transport system substrate-binding protein